MMWELPNAVREAILAETEWRAMAPDSGQNHPPTTNTPLRWKRYSKARARSWG